MARWMAAWCRQSSVASRRVPGRLAVHAAYRDWLWRACGLAEEERRRADWVKDIHFTLSWYGGDPAILDALARKLGHKIPALSRWRTDAYVRTTRPMCLPTRRVRSSRRPKRWASHQPPQLGGHGSLNQPITTCATQYRDVQTRRLIGWGWDKNAGELTSECPTPTTRSPRPP